MTALNDLDETAALRPSVAPPTSKDFCSDTLIHSFGDLWNPPGLTNFLGCAQVDLDPVAVRSVSFPPFAMGELSTGHLFLDDRLFTALGVPVSVTWRPDQVHRSALWDGLLVETRTVVPMGEMAVVVRISVRNTAATERRVPIRLALRAGLTKKLARWTEASPPWEEDNELSLDHTRRALVWTSRLSGATAVQGGAPAADTCDEHGIRWCPTIGSDETWEASYVLTFGEDVDQARQTYDQLCADPETHVARAEQEWDAEIASVFDPASDRYSGSLPMLETNDPDLRRIWHMGIIGVVYFKRDNPYSVMGRTYDTLMPRYWQSLTFLWDYSLSSLVHSLLDPAVMRRYLAHWIATDVHTHMGTEWLTGEPVGVWYAVNDYAMCQTIDAYVRATGDTAFLATELPGPGGEPLSVVGHLDRYACNWRRFRSESGLANYGGIGNLLECVSTYINEVASLNGANVWMLRKAAEVATFLGDEIAALWYEAEAGVLAKDVQQLYAEGDGWWYARQRDGRMVPVRHCYDFSTVAATIPEELSETQRAEMVAFFVRELQTPTWMRALSDRDADASFSVRPDHQWTGAYPAWPPTAAAALYTFGRADLAAQWIHGLAQSANQGPFGQSHFADGVVPQEAGGALKAPAEMPWINDWTCSSNGSWVDLVVRSVFGVHWGLDGQVTATPELAGLDPQARLVGLVVQGRTWDVDATGAHERT
ncbi:MAG: hypothetical protein ABIO67_05810 [Mycobacteriales bacterium]